MAHFKFNNVDVVTMVRGTDSSFDFQYTLDSGSVFTPSLYTIACEGRLAYANEVADFVFPVTSANSDTGWVQTISFPKTIVTEYIREQKIYWKTLATDSNGKTILISHGEIWLS